MLRSVTALSFQVLTPVHPEFFLLCSVDETLLGIIII